MEKGNQEQDGEPEELPKGPNNRFKNHHPAAVQTRGARDWMLMDTYPGHQTPMPPAV